MKEIGGVLSDNLPKKYATRKLPRFFAYVLAFFHPKLSIKRLKDTLGKHVGYDVGDSFEVLSVPEHDVAVTLVDSVNSLQAQD